MRVVVNGLAREISPGLTVSQLLEQEGEPVEHVLVEIDGVYLPVREYAARVLEPGERIEIILPAYGG